jgi:hypothetical protein
MVVEYYRLNGSRPPKGGGLSNEVELRTETSVRSHERPIDRNPSSTWTNLDAQLVEVGYVNQAYLFASPSYG